MLASLGSLPVIVVPLVRTPLPASGMNGSVFCCAPYLATEKLARLLRLVPSLATQPRVGMVMLGCAPVAWASEIKLSTEAPAVVPVSEILSKNQSAAWLLAFCCQL